MKKEGLKEGKVVLQRNLEDGESGNVKMGWERESFHFSFSQIGLSSGDFLRL